MSHTQLISYTFNLHRHISVEPIIGFFSLFFIENFYQAQMKTSKSNICRDMDACAKSNTSLTPNLSMLTETIFLYHEALVQCHDLFHKECIPFCNN